MAKNDWIPLPQPLQSGVVSLPLLGHRCLRQGPRWRRREGAVVGSVLAAGQDVLRGVLGAPAAHLSRNVAVHSPRRIVGMVSGNSKCSLSLDLFDLLFAANYRVKCG